MVHGSPGDFRESLTAATPYARLIELAAISQSDIVICGHSHPECFRSRTDQTRFINPGCIERSFNGDRRPGCVVLEINDDDYAVNLLRVEYDWKVTLEKMINLEFPLPLQSALKRAETKNRSS